MEKAHQRELEKYKEERRASSAGKQQYSFFRKRSSRPVSPPRGYDGGEGNEYSENWGDWGVNGGSNRVQNEKSEQGESKCWINGSGGRAEENRYAWTAYQCNDGTNHVERPGVSRDTDWDRGGDSYDRTEGGSVSYDRAEGGGFYF